MVLFTVMRARKYMNRIWQVNVQAAPLVLVITLVIWLILAFPSLTLAQWAEPTCDPSVNPDDCNVSAPLNVSGATQTKQGGLNIVGSMTIGQGFTLSSGGILNLPSNSITDVFVRDDVTAGQFIRGTGTTGAVDLSSWSVDASGAANSEVVGVLPSGAATVQDIWVNQTGDTMSGTLDITPSSTGYGIQVRGKATDKSLIYLYAPNSDSVIEGTALSINTQSGSSSRALAINSQSISTAYPIDVNVTGSPLRGINILTSVVGGVGLYSKSAGSDGMGVYSIATGSSGTGVYGYGISHGVEGASSGDDGVYGLTTSAGKAGVAGIGNGDNYGVYGTTKAPGRAGVIGIGVDKDVDNLDSENYGVYGESNANNKGAIFGVSTHPTGFGGHFKGKIGVFGESTGTDNFSEGVAGVTKADKAPGVYGLNSNSISTVGYGLWGEAWGENGIGVYGTGKRYGAEFDGQSGIGVYGKGNEYGAQFDGGVLSSDRIIGTQFLSTQQPYAPLDNALRGDETAVALAQAHATPDYKYLKNLIFDGSTIWAADNPPSGVTTFLRIDPATLLIRHQTQLSSLGTTSELISIPGPDSGIAFWDQVGALYFYKPSDSSPQKLVTNDAYNRPKIQVGVAINSQDLVIGASDGTGVFTLTNGLTITSASSYRAVPHPNGVGGWGNIRDMVADTENQVYVLNDKTSGTDELVTLTENLLAVDSVFTLPSNYNPQTMVFDGKYIWIRVVNGSTHSLVRFNVRTKTFEQITVSGTCATVIYSIEFDGTSLWLGCSDKKIYRVSPDTGQYVYDSSGSAIAVAANDIPRKLLFDGGYLWVTGATDVHKVFVGGNFSYAEPLVRNGINLFSNLGEIYCVYVNSLGGISTKPGQCDEFQL